MYKRTPEIRPMTVYDINAAVEIERLCFSDPWRRGDFLYDLTSNACARYYVMERDHVIVGYTGMWVIIGEVHVVNLAVHPKHRKKGYGWALLAHLAREAYDKMEIRRMTLEVRTENLAAIRLYERAGFRITDRLEGYYENGGDAWSMELPDTAALLRPGG